MIFEAPIPVSSGQRVLLFSDLHYPAHSRHAVKELIQLIKDTKPTRIINLGDVFDQKELSRFEPNHIPDFIESGKAMPQIWAEGIEFHDTLLDAAPKGCLHEVIYGNHDIRARTAMESVRHIVGLSYNPFTDAWMNSRHRLRLYQNYPNNDLILVQGKHPLILSHNGGGTGGNHGKSTWVKDFSLGASRIYGHLHTEDYWRGTSSINKAMRDERFAWGLGAMCDRSHKYFDYCNLRIRANWRPMAAIIRTNKSGTAEFEAVHFTPDPLPYETPVYSR